LIIQEPICWERAAAGFILRRTAQPEDYDSLSFTEVLLYSLGVLRRVEGSFVWMLLNKGRFREKEKITLLQFIAGIFLILGCYFILKASNNTGKESNY